MFNLGGKFLSFIYVELLHDFCTTIFHGKHVKMRELEKFDVA